MEVLAAFALATDSYYFEGIFTALKFGQEVFIVNIVTSIKGFRNCHLELSRYAAQRS